MGCGGAEERQGCWEELAVVQIRCGGKEEGKVFTAKCLLWQHRGALFRRWCPSFPFPGFSSEYKKSLGPCCRLSAAVGRGSVLKALGQCCLQNKHFRGLLLRLKPFLRQQHSLQALWMMTFSPRSLQTNKNEKKQSEGRGCKGRLIE